MRWALVVLVVIANPFEHHVASFKAQSPWRNGISALSKVFDNVTADLRTQQTFQKDKEAYCKAQHGATKRRMAEAKSSTSILTNDRVKLEAEVEGLRGEVGTLEEKLAGIRAEIESTQAERAAEEKTENEDVIALKAAVVSADYASGSTGIRDVLKTRLLTMGAQHRKMVAILVRFAKQKRSAMLKLEEELQLKRTKVLEKQTALADVIRTMNDNKRTLTRDAAYVKALEHECEVFSKNEQKLKISRARLRDLLQKSIALIEENIKESRNKTALTQDTRSPTTPTFLQIQAHSRDVFDDVRRRIEEMLRQMESNMNKDKGRHEWCAEEKKSNDRDRQKYQDDMSAHQSAIRRIKNQMVAAVGSHSFAHEMATENMKIVKRAKDESTSLDGRFTKAANTVDELMHVVTEVKKAVKTLDESTKVVTYLSEVEAEAEKLKGLLKTAKSETKITLDEVREKAKKALEARRRDAQDVDLQKAELQDALVEAETDYNTSKNNLDKAREYQETLASDCGPANTDMVAKRRNEEIEALQDALKVLNGEQIPT